LDRRAPLPRPAGAPPGHRGLDRGGAGRARHSGRDDRRRAAEGARHTSMNGAHDLGGMHGFGPVVLEPDEPVFHQEWERRVFALSLAMTAWRRWNLDMARFSR